MAKLNFRLHGETQYDVKLTIINCSKYFSKFFLFKYINNIIDILIMFKILKKYINNIIKCQKK